MGLDIMDFLMIENGDGGELDITDDGDLKLNYTLYNAVYLSLFGGKAFYDGIDIEGEDGDDVDIEAEFNKPATPDNLKNLAALISSKLNWMSNSGLIKTADATALTSLDKKTEVILTITQPDDTTEKYSIIWDCEKSELKHYGAIYGRI